MPCDAEVCSLRSAYFHACIRSSEFPRGFSSHSWGWRSTGQGEPRLLILTG